MNLKTLVLSAAVVIAMTSCSHKTTLPYFTDITDQKEGVIPKQEYLPKVQSDDELQILVSSTSPEATVAYNLPFVNAASRDVITKTSTPRYQTYVVDSKGDIEFPILGKIHVAGKNIEQIEEMLYNEISRDVKDPIVTVTLANFKVVVAGEVKMPQTISVNGNRISILDALATAGDLTEYGERSNILVIRENNGERTFAHLDLNSSDILTSPYYYLQQNDYVYVAPNKIRQANSKYNTNNSFKLSVISTVVSACSVIASLIIALTK